MDGWGWLEPRAAEDLWARQFNGGLNDDDNDSGSTNSNGTDGRPWFNDTGGGRNFTAAAINNFRFQAAKSIRTSTIILSVFNVVAAFATAAGILWDGYATAKRNNPKYTFRASAFSCIRSPETFPLVLSCGIVVQGIVFAVAQSTGLKGMLVLGCTITSQLMLPAVFIVPYIQLVFGLEVVIRSFQRRMPFSRRGKWNVTICLAIVGMLLLVTYIVTHFIRPPNFCFASLFWFLQRYKRGCFVLLTLIATVLLVSVVIIFIKLHRNTSIDPIERVAASRMVFYLSLGFISAALILPFLVDISFITTRGSSFTALQLSSVAAVVANVSGLMTGGLHLFLRSSAIATIGPRGMDGKYDDDDKENFKRGIRRYTPEDGDNYNYKNPSEEDLRRMDTNGSLESSDREKGYDADEERGFYDEDANPLRSNAVYSTPDAVVIQPPEPARAPSGHAPKNSYSLFPGSSNIANAKPPSLLPAAAYDPSAKETTASPGMLKPPAPIHGSRHRRESSLASHTTVQIGLRLSNVDDMPPQDGGQVHSLECPYATAGATAKRPSPLTNAQPGDEPALGSDAAVGATGAEKEEKECKLCTLAPAVYKPPTPKAARTKMTSPKGVGFEIPRSNSGRGREAPPARHVEQRVPVKKADWI